MLLYMKCLMPVHRAPDDEVRVMTRLLDTPLHSNHHSRGGLSETNSAPVQVPKLEPPTLITSSLSSHICSTKWSPHTSAYAAHVLGRLASPCCKDQPAPNHTQASGPHSDSSRRVPPPYPPELLISALATSPHYENVNEYMNLSPLPTQSSCVHLECPPKALSSWDNRWRNWWKATMLFCF